MKRDIRTKNNLIFFISMDSIFDLIKYSYQQKCIYNLSYYFGPMFVIHSNITTLRRKNCFFSFYEKND